MALHMSRFAFVVGGAVIVTLLISVMPLLLHTTTNSADAQTTQRVQVLNTPLPVNVTNSRLLPVMTTNIPTKQYYKTRLEFTQDPCVMAQWESRGYRVIAVSQTNAIYDGRPGGNWSTSTVGFPPTLPSGRTVIYSPTAPGFTCSSIGGGAPAFNWVLYEAPWVSGVL